MAVGRGCMQAGINHPLSNEMSSMRALLLLHYSQTKTYLHVHSESVFIARWGDGAETHTHIVKLYIKRVLHRMFLFFIGLAARKNAVLIAHHFHELFFFLFKISALTSIKMGV
jgi:hypothetical protein